MQAQVQNEFIYTSNMSNEATRPHLSNAVRPWSKLQGTYLKQPEKDKYLDMEITPITVRWAEINWSGF